MGFGGALFLDLPLGKTNDDDDGDDVGKWKLENLDTTNTLLNSTWIKTTDTPARVIYTRNTSDKPILHQ